MLMHTTATAATRKSWLQRLEADWLLAEEVAALDQPGRSVTTQADAAGGCGGIKNGEWGFHTDHTANPWWQVDLGTVRPLDRVVIWNRTTLAERAARIQVLLSEDGQQFRQVYQHDGTVFLGFQDNQQLVVPLEAAAARFVRLALPGPNYPHLDEVEVFGVAEPETNLALNQPADQDSVSPWSAAHDASPRAVDWVRRTQETLAVCERLVAERQLPSKAPRDSGLRPSSSASGNVLFRGKRQAAAVLQDAGAQIQRLKQKLAVCSTDESARALFLEARRLQRRLALRNPLLHEFDALLFTKRVPGRFNHMSDQYYGWWSQPGGGIYLLRGFTGDSPSEECLTTAFTEPGSFLRPTLSYDGKKVLFAWCRYYPHLAAETNKLDKANIPEDAFYHLFKMNLEGSGLRQLTRGKYDDFDGRYLPDGRIVFLRTRRGPALQVGRHSAARTVARPDLPDCYVRCGGGPERPVAVYTLHTMRADGSDLVAISPFEMFEWTPEIARDGRILYSRWDYIDRDNMPHMGLWAINPDGTDARLVYGNYTHAPHCAFEAKPIPGSHKIVFTGSAHHAQTMGSLVLLWTQAWARKARNRSRG